MPPRPLEIASTVEQALQFHRLQRHHDLAEMLVGFHVLERFSDLGERIDLVDRQLQLSGFHRAPDILTDFVKNLAGLLDGGGAEGDADIVDAAGGMQVEIEIAMGAAEPADIDDAALDLGGTHGAFRSEEHTSEIQ